MNTSLTTVGPDTAFSTLLVKQCNWRTRQIYVVDQGFKLLGIVTTHNLLSRLVPQYLDSTLSKTLPSGDSLFAKHYRESSGLTAKEVMTTDFISLGLDDVIIEAGAIIKDRRFNGLPVLDEQGVLRGDIGRKDILRYITAKVCGLDIG